MVVGEISLTTELLVIGAGPGGYAAAFRAADLGVEVTLVDSSGRLGGLCLHEGCIPSKTLLHLAELSEETKEAEKMGLNFSAPQVELKRLRAWKNSVIEKIAKGLKGLAAKRDIQFIKGQALFEAPDQVRVLGSDVAHIRFRQAIIATGSTVNIPPPFLASPSPKIIDSSAALEIKQIPESLLVVGGGYIAVEMGQVYQSLGCKVSMAVRSRILRRVDEDLCRPLTAKMERICQDIFYAQRIIACESRDDGVEVALEDDTGKTTKRRFSQVLLAVGRSPNTHNLGLAEIGIQTDKNGFIEVDEELRTNSKKIFAVGDVTPGPMLAHRAMAQGKVCAEIISGLPRAFEPQAIAAVIYGDPQIAWCGLTEAEAVRQDMAHRVCRFPWQASGRAATMGLEDKGLTKLIFEPESGRLLGAGVVGRGAEGLIAELLLAVEMGALAEDLSTITHPHPSLSETVGEAAELLSGNACHYLNV